MKIPFLLALTLITISTPAVAQYCGEWDPNNPGCWAQQREQEEKRQRDAAEEARRRDEAWAEQQERDAQNAEEMRSSEPARAEAARRNAEWEAELNAMRARLLATPPLPPERNPLLGRWRVEGSDKPRPNDDWAQLQELLANPGASMCAMLFGEGTTEFLPGSWASADSYGNDSLGNIQYRKEGGRIYALPDQGVPLLGFDVVDSNRINEVRMPDCALVRVGAPLAISPTPAQASVPVPASGKSATAPVDPNTPLGRGKRLHDEKDFQPALRELLVAAEAAPDDPRVHVYLADTYHWLGMKAEADKAAARAKQLDPAAFDILR